MVGLIDGQLLPEKVGAKPIDAVLTSMLEGLESLQTKRPAGLLSLSISIRFRHLSADTSWRGYALARLTT
jgi:hypothetical protein